MTAADAELVRAWRASSEGRAVIAVNTTFRIAPWADALYAMDRQWWFSYQREVRDVFKGDLFSAARVDIKLSVKQLDRDKFQHFSNSGAGAVALAILLGAKSVYLLGYDCQRLAGRSHWHGDHPKPLTNVASIDRWVRFFDRLKDHAEKQGVAVVNCSRETALKSFQRRPLESVCARPRPEGLPAFYENPVTA